VVVRASSNDDEVEETGRGRNPNEDMYGVDCACSTTHFPHGVLMSAW